MSKSSKSNGKMSQTEDCQKSKLLFKYQVQIQSKVVHTMYQGSVLTLQHSSLRQSFFQGIATIKTIICFTARILQRIQICHSQGHTKSPRKSLPYIFFSAGVVGRNFSHFSLLKCDSGTRQYKKKSRFWRFWLFKHYYVKLMPVDLW